MQQKKYHHSGLTLIELIIVLSIVAVLMAGIFPLLVQGIRERKVRETRDELQAVMEAIKGRPEQGFYGFLSDIGRLPYITDTCNELVKSDCNPTPVPLPAASIGPGGVVHGWNGPYLASSNGPEHWDEWRKPYSLDMTGLPGNRRWQYRSGGPDRDVSSATDNIVVPTTPARLESELNVKVKIAFKTGTHYEYQNDITKDHINFEVFYSKDGEEKSVNYPGPTVWDTINDVFHFPPPGASINPLHYGMHAIKTTIIDPNFPDCSSPPGAPPSCVSTHTVFVRGGQQTNTLWVEVPSLNQAEFETGTKSFDACPSTPTGAIFITIPFTKPVKHFMAAAMTDTDVGSGGDKSSWHIKSWIRLGNNVQVRIWVDNDGSCSPGETAEGHGAQLLSYIAIFY